MSNAETLSLLTPVPCKPFSILRYKGDTCNTPRRLSTTASLETYPLYLFVQASETFMAYNGNFHLSAVAH